MIASFGNRCDFGCFFQIPGNVEDEREALMIDVTKGSIIGRQSLMTRVGTLSIPGALLEGIAFIMSSTCLHEM